MPQIFSFKNLVLCLLLPWMKVPFFAGRKADVRFGSSADICIARSDVRFTPNSDRESGLRQTVMSALSPIADMCGALAHVRYGPKADISRLFDHRVGPGEQRRRQFPLLTRMKQTVLFLAVVSS
jgi:hypothetical protein